MVSALLAMGVVSLRAGLLAEPAKLEEFGPYRALAVTVNGRAKYALIDPLNQESYAMTNVQEAFGTFLQVKYMGLDKDMNVEETFYREDELPRSASDKKISIVIGEDFFTNKVVGIDYFNETMQVFEPNSVNDAMNWLKAGSPDDEPSVIRLAMAKSVDDVWQTDQLKVDGEKWQLMPLLLDSYSDQSSHAPPPRWADLWDQGGPDGGIYNRSFWRNVEFGGQPMPFFIGTWSEMPKDMPGLRGTVCMRDLGSKRLLYDAAKHEIWFTLSSATDQMCALLSSQVFRFPVRLVGKELKVGRIPRFDDTSGDGLCSGGTIVGVDSYTGDEVVSGLLAGGEARQKMVRDLVMRSKQRITVEVMCTDGKKRSIYVNSLLSGG